MLVLNRIIKRWPSPFPETVHLMTFFSVELVFSEDTCWQQHDV